MKELINKQIQENIDASQKLLNEDLLKYSIEKSVLSMLLRYCRIRFSDKNYSMRITKLILATRYHPKVS